MITGDVLGERARLAPKKLALVDVECGERLTYAELDRRANRAARACVTRLGLAPGERFGVLSHNRIEFLELFFAAGKSGLVIVPLDVRLGAAELAPLVLDAGLKALFFDPLCAPAALALRERLGDAVPHWVSFGEGLAPADRNWRALVHALDDGPLDVPHIDPEQPYALFFGSCGEGKPRGVIAPHRMIAWNAIGTALSWNLDEHDVASVFTPLHHAGGLVFLTSLLAVGGTIVLHHGFDAGEVWRTIARERCTVVAGVPAVWQRLLESPEFATADLGAVRWFISGGAPLPQFLVDAYQRRGIVFKQGYGLTELGVNCFAITPAESAAKPGSIGRPMMFTRAKLVDPEGHEVSDDEDGELCVAGPHVCAGYWNDPRGTARALDAEGWFHTGDLARRDADGFYYALGPLDDVIVTGGVSVRPAEIESALVRHPHVSDAAVIGVPDGPRGEAVIAFVVYVPDAEPDEPELREHLAAQLAAAKLPREIVVVDALPRDPLGNVERRELRATYLAAHCAG